MLYEQCIWRLKCFLSIQVKKYLVYLFLASWEWFLQTSALQSASTEERLSGDFLLIKSCVYEFFGVDKKWPYETKNRYIGYFMNKIDRKHIVLQVKTKNVIRFPPLEKLLSLKVMKPSKTAVKTADRSYHFKRHCIWWNLFGFLFLFCKINVCLQALSCSASTHFYDRWLIFLLYLDSLHLLPFSATKMEHSVQIKLLVEL